MARSAGSPFLDPDDPKWKVRPKPPPVPRRRGSRWRRFRLPVGRVLGRTFSIWFRSLPVFFLLGLVVYSPVLVCYAILHVRWGTEVETLGSILQFAVFAKAVTFLFLSSLLSGVVTHGVISRSRGDRARFLPALRAGFTRAVPILLVGLFSTLLSIAGAILLVVPGLMLVTFLSVALPVAVVERPRALGLAALSRSVHLVRGQGWAVFGTIVVVQIVAYLLRQALQVPLVILSLGSMQVSLVLLLQTALDLVTATLTATAPAVLYHELRLGKEGVDVDELLAVFS